MKRVIIESPYKSKDPAIVARNVRYARKCLLDSLMRGEAPLASHLLYTQPGILRDDIPAERRLGIDAGLAWGNPAEATVVYTDLGVTPGMEQGIARAEAEERPVEYRKIDWEDIQEEAATPGKIDPYSTTFPLIRSRAEFQEESGTDVSFVRLKSSASLLFNEFMSQSKVEYSSPQMADLLLSHIAMAARLLDKFSPDIRGRLAVKSFSCRQVVDGEGEHCGMCNQFFSCI